MSDAKPFIKWTGGKRRLLPRILEQVGDGPIRNYVEPFLGGGAVFFALHERIEGRAYLADACQPLVDGYRGVRDYIDWVCAILDSMAEDDCKEFFYQQREALDGPAMLGVTAARFIYLNRTCFNGMWRTRKDGTCATSWGHKKFRYDEANLRACSRVLQRAAIDGGRFQDLFNLEKLRPHVGEGDLVYLDPPYEPEPDGRGYTKYTASGFDVGCQEQVRDLALDCHRRGARVIASNSNVPLTRALYSGEPFRVSEVPIHYTVGGSNKARRKTSELLITTFERVS